MGTLDWISVCLYISKPFYPFILSCLIISLFLLQKKRSIRVRIHVRITRTFVWNFKTQLQKRAYILTGRFHSNHPPTNSCVFPWKYVLLRFAVIVQTAREMTCTVPRKIRQKLLSVYMPHPLLPGTWPLQKFPTPGPIKKSWTCPGGCLGGW